MGLNFSKLEMTSWFNLRNLAKTASSVQNLEQSKLLSMEQFAYLPEEHRVVALQVAEVAMNNLIDRVAQSIGCDVRDYPGGYWIEFEIKAVVCKAELSDISWRFFCLQSLCLLGEASSSDKVVV
jgi:hypothetical protein